MKRLSMCLLVSVLVCSCVWAFPGRSKADELPVLPVIQETQEDIILPEIPQEEPATIEEPAAEEEALPSAPEPQPQPEPMLDEGLIQLVELLETFEDASKLNKEQLTSLLNELEVIKTEYELIVEDVEDKETQIGLLADLNAAQADDLAYLRGAYDKETATKAYARTGLVLGFEDMVPTYGVSAALGARFGKGFLLDVGAQYMIGTFKNALVAPSLDNLAITASIGWEW